MMYLSSLIHDVIKNDSVITAYVYGEMGTGKTSYALWVASEVLGGWDDVLKYLFFRPEDAISAVSKAVATGVKLPIIIMDDAGIWLDRMTWWEKEKVSFMKFFNLIRSVAHSIIFTTPSEELPRQIINKCFIRVNVRRTGYDELKKKYGDISGLLKVVESHNIKPIFSLAVGYVTKMLPSFIQLVRKEFYDAYPTYYPLNVFKRYEEIRKDAVKSLLNEWEYELRKKTIDDAASMLERGVKKSEVVKYLMRRGMSRATAYRLLAKIEGVNE